MDGFGYSVISGCSGRCTRSAATRPSGRTGVLAAESTNGNPRTMATIDNHQQESHKPLHAGDSEAAMWGIEKDPLLRQTMTAVLILDRPPDRHARRVHP
jgi:hypothetical protein